MDTPSSVDVVALVARLGLADKVRLLTGATTFTLWPEPSIGLSELRMSDGPTGVRGLKLIGGRTVALFPTANLLAASWSEEALREVGDLLAEEALAQDIHVVLGPTINLHRSVLAGRLFEEFSEDPLLTGRLAAAYILGLQARGVAACLKHLVANESETERTTVDSVIDQATLRELYLLPFEIAVHDADPWSIMAAYNRVNGVAATEQGDVINGIVKGEWGYLGLVVSDWNATRTAAPAANGGLDLVMPGPRGPWGEALVRAVQAGEVTEATIDDHLTRLLVLAERVGALGQSPAVPEFPAPDSPQRKEQLRRLAAAGMTVLVNRDSTLPLVRGQRAALIGRHALQTIAMGGGSAQVRAPYQVSIADGLRALLGADVAVHDGVEVRNRPVPAGPGVLTDPVDGQPGLHLWMYAADGTLLEERHAPLAATAIGFDDAFPQRVARAVFRTRVELTGRAEVGVMGVGDWTVTLADLPPREASLRVSGLTLGEELMAPPFSVNTAELAGPALLEATLLLVGAGLAKPLPPGSAPPRGAGVFSLVARPAPLDQDDVLAAAVEAARTADIAVVVVGLTDEAETETVDKSTLALPGNQDAMVFAVAAAASRTVVVVNAATPVLMPWLEVVDAVLWVGLPGQEGGHAVAAALLGDLEPAGRLVTTFPAADGAAPAWSVTPVDGRLPYTEGTFIGHRGHFAGLAPEPLFWFGHGLGYTTWSYDAVSLVEAVTPTVAVTVRNTGDRAGREVVQVYFVPADETFPVRLVGWTAVRLEAGAAATVTVAADPRLLRRWDETTSTWAALPRTGQLLVARGLGDIRGRVALGPQPFRRT